MRTMRGSGLPVAAGLAALAWLGCGSAGGPTSPVAAQAHDCVPYQPTQASGSFTGTTWSVPNERDTWSFTVPNDPGGGYVTVTLTAQNGKVVPWMNLDVAPAGGTVIASGAAAPGQQTITDVFEVAAGKTIEIEALPWVNAPLNEYPVNYSLTWTFTSRVDCYEPNNAAPNSWPAPVSAAKAIPIGQAIEATAIVGHDENGPPSGVRLFDWYKFTLTTSRTLNISTVQVPPNVKVGLRIFAQDGSVHAAAPVPASAGQTTQTGPTVFPPGTWYIEFFPAERGASAVRTSAGEQVPAHFTTSYRLLISG